MDSVALQKFIEQMKSNSPAETRVSLIREVISATYVESIIVRSMQAMALGMALGMGQHACPSSAGVAWRASRPW